MNRKFALLSALVITLGAAGAGQAAPQSNATGATQMSVEQAQKNKEVVLRLYNEIFFTPKPNIPLLDQIIREDYIQHNPMAGQGREALRYFVLNVFSKNRPSEAEIKSMKLTLVAEDDLVVARMITANGLLIDVFRFENGQIAEHWDAYRPNPGTERLAGF